MVSRRKMLGLLGAGTAIGWAGCTTGMSLIGTDAAGTDAPGTDTGGGSCTALPAETAGPYPGDGSNGPNVLSIDGVVRSDITRSFGGASAVAAGIPLSVTLSLLDTACRPLAGYAIYLWHCDRDGNYSLYSAGVTEENYLRGVQETDASGQVTFQTTFPGCYSGRWPHMHFEIYSALDAATVHTNAIRTTQLGMPEAACDEAYGVAGYEASVRNFGSISLASDNVFNDGWDTQIASVTGSTSGYAASLVVPVAV